MNESMVGRYTPSSKEVHKAFLPRQSADDMGDDEICKINNNAIPWISSRVFFFCSQWEMDAAEKLSV